MKLNLRFCYTICLLFFISCAKLPEGPESIINNKISKLKFVYTNSKDIFTISSGDVIKNITHSPEREYNEFKISPDGSKILYDRYLNNKVELCIINVDGSDFEILETNQSYFFNATFSPDGKKITYTSDIDGDAEVYIMNLKTKDKKNISNTHFINNKKCYDGYSVFSPDGSSIAYSTERFSDQTMQIIITDLNGDNIRCYSKKDGYAFGAKFSYSGDYLVYSFQSPDPFDQTISIYSIDLRTRKNILLTQGQRVSTNKAREFFSISPKQNLIAYIAQRQNGPSSGQEIYLAHLDGSKNIMLTNFNPDPHINNGGILSPNFNHDGSKLVFKRVPVDGFFIIDIKSRKIESHTYIRNLIIKYIDFLY